MASSASPDLKIQLMATGENSGAWGTITNDNLSALEEAIARTTDVTFAATATVSVTLSDSNASQQGRNYRLNLTGTGTAGQILFVNNTGANPITFHNTEATALVRGIHADHDTMEANFMGMFVSDGTYWNLIAGGVDSQPDVGLTAS